MRLLLTNDDGFGAEGLAALEEALSPGHELWVVAPAENRSGVSHGITMGKALGYERRGERSWACTGTPADCVILAVRGLMPEPPDMVVAGINRGANIGTDILFSGTAAAARQASLWGIPAVALSLMADDAGAYLWEPLARFAEENLELLASLGGADSFVNVNARSAPSYAGSALAGVARRHYRDGVELCTDGEGMPCSRFIGGNLRDEGNVDSDWFVVNSGRVAVSRILSLPQEKTGGLSRIPRFRV